MSSTNRKYESGSSKRKKKQRIEELIQSQRGALDKFFTKEVNSDLNVNCVDDLNANIECADTTGNDDANVDCIDETNVDCVDDLNANIESADTIESADIIWFEILHAVNLVSKQLQSKNILIDDAIVKVKGLISFFERYRETGFENALEQAKEIATRMEIDPVFPQKRKIRRKRQFDEVSNNISTNALESREESFRISYFLYVMDHAIPSLSRRFEQYQNFESIFGFLFSSKKLYSLDDICLKSSCMNIEIVLKNHEKSDIDGNDLYAELKLLQDFLPKGIMQPVDILNYLQRVDCFPNATIVYRILLTIPVTVATAERSFSKLKLLKCYLRSTMTQERLNGLAMVAIENDLLEKINFEELIENFVSNNARRILLFK